MKKQRRNNSFNEQKRIEKLCLGKYLEASGQSFQILINEDEPPDFVLINENVTIGCEITEYHRDNSQAGSKYREREQFLKGLHEAIKEAIAKSTISKGYSLSIWYNQQINGRTKIAQEVNDVLASMVNRINDHMELEIENSTHRSIPNPTSNVGRIFWKTSQDPSLPTRTIFAMRIDYEEPKISSLQNIIDQKAITLKKANQTYKELWLIIAFGISMEGTVNINRFSNSGDIVNKDWDKIVLIDVSTKEYEEYNRIKS